MCQASISISDIFILGLFGALIIAAIALLGVAVWSMCSTLIQDNRACKRSRARLEQLYDNDY